MSDTTIEAAEFLTVSDVMVLAHAREILRSAQEDTAWDESEKAWRYGYVSARAEAGADAIFEFLNSAAHYGYSTTALAAMPLLIAGPDDNEEEQDG